MNAEATWTMIGTIIASLGFAATVISLYFSNLRIKRQATLDAFTEFKRSNKEIENKIHSKEFDTNAILEKHRQKERAGDVKAEWEQIKVYLSDIERIAVGVNTRIYDAGIINRMGGYFMYEQYQLLEPIIYYKREQDNNPQIYKEFTDMVNKIIRCRKRRKQDCLQNVM